MTRTQYYTREAARSVVAAIMLFGPIIGLIVLAKMLG